MDGSEATRWANSRSFRTWQDRDKNNANFSTFEMRRHLKGVSGASPVRRARPCRGRYEFSRNGRQVARRHRQRTQGDNGLKRKLMSAKAALDRAGDHDATLAESFSLPPSTLHNETSKGQPGPPCPVNDVYSHDDFLP